MIIICDWGKKIVLFIHVNDTMMMLLQVIF